MWPRGDPGSSDVPSGTGSREPSLGVPSRGGQGPSPLGCLRPGPPVCRHQLGLQFWVSRGHPGDQPGPMGALSSPGSMTAQPGAPDVCCQPRPTPCPSKAHPCSGRLGSWELALGGGVDPPTTPSCGLSLPGTQRGLCVLPRDRQLRERQAGCGSGGSPQGFHALRPHLLLAAVPWRAGPGVGARVGGGAERAPPGSRPKARPCSWVPARAPEGGFCAGHLPETRERLPSEPGPQPGSDPSGPRAGAGTAGLGTGGLHST